MKTKTELEAEKLGFVQKARDIAAKAETEGRNLTAEERSEVKTLIDSAKATNGEILALDGDAKMIEDLNVLGSPVGELAKSAGIGRTRGKTIGESFTDDPTFAAWMKTIAPNGNISQKSRVGNSPAIQLGGMKDILSGSVTDGDGAAGALVSPQWLGLLDGLGQFTRPLTVADLVTKGQTTSDAVEYARVTGFTNNAAAVPEATGSSAGTGQGDVAGTKPESAMTLEKVTANVKTLAHWLPATKRALSDAAQIRTLIDEFLRYGLAEELEDQIVAGDDTGENFEGILEVSGTQSQAFDTDILVTTRKAKTKVGTGGRTTPTAFVLNPADNETIDLIRDGSGGSENSGAFLFGGPSGNGVQTLWGLPRIESEAIPEGTGIVANWRMAVLWDREQAAIQISDSHEDFFVRNLVAVLGEMRAAFGVIRPAAFVEIDLTEGS